jgi:tRNA (uracil-5-)-methyltransferase TRM9
LEGVSLDHGRVLIYVWAIEQDELSKRTVHSDDQLSENLEQSSVMPHGQDVFVPWVLPNASSTAVNQANVPNAPQVFNRYYHMFAQGELLVLVEEAVRVLGLVLGDASGSIIGTSGVEVVRHGWERSNHYVELRRWKR